MLYSFSKRVLFKNECLICNLYKTSHVVELIHAKNKQHTQVATFRVLIIDNFPCCHPQVGNAVPPPMAREIGREIKKCVHWKDQQMQEVGKAALEVHNQSKEDKPEKKEALPDGPGTSN